MQVRCRIAHVDPIGLATIVAYQSRRVREFIYLFVALSLFFLFFSICFFSLFFLCFCSLSFDFVVFISFYARSLFLLCEANMCMFMYITAIPTSNILPPDSVPTVPPLMTSSATSNTSPSIPTATLAPGASTAATQPPVPITPPPTTAPSLTASGAATCPGTIYACNGNGLCENGKCVCATGWSGATCSTGNEVVQTPSTKKGLKGYLIEREKQKG